MLNTKIGAIAAVTALVGSVLLSATASAQVIKAAPDEREQLKACEARLCEAALTKKQDGSLSCKIQKTWTKSYIEDGVRQKKITWTFGDAQCGVDLNLNNAEVAKAMGEGKHTVQFDKHTVTCNIERESKMTTVKLDMAPKIEFEGGKAKKAWINVSNIDAPTIIKGAIWTVAKLEDNFGLFHGEMISEINEFLGEKCARRYPQFAQN